MRVRHRPICRFALNSEVIRRLVAAGVVFAAPNVLPAQRAVRGDLHRSFAADASDGLRCISAATDSIGVPCDAGGAPVLRAVQQATPQEPASAWSVVASAVVPGTGQAMLGVERFLPYMAFETYLWTQYATHVREYRRYRNGYQELSSRVARSAFTIVYPHGDFEYYERMKHYMESGRFEMAVGGVLDPEMDTTTFNGSVWLLARRTYWNDIDVAPDTSTDEWKRATDFYVRRAYDQPYRWSWSGAPLEYDEFRRLIRRTNDTNRKSLEDLGAIIANHMLSAVDAFVTVRLRRRGSQGAGADGWELNGSLPLATLSRLRRH